MVNHKNTKRKRDIKTKLMAAICMLMVSVIMMVSTTYAWFTLSTAPEVTGINTAVGANGNLEMALMPADAIAQAANNFGITSEAGDSTKAVNLRNSTWGNLVDVSENTFYGMNNITLYPAALNITEAGNLADAMLKTPAYGADGRVSELKADTVTSLYDTNLENFPQKEGLGVRAVGNASGMTDRQLAYRNARSAANTAMAMAKTLASQSLNTNGASLANIAMNHATSPDNLHTQEEVQSLLNIVYDLTGTEEKTGVLQYIENAYLNYIVALGASQASVAAMDDGVFATFKTAMTGAADVYTAVGLCTNYGVNLPETVTAPIAKLQATKATVNEAKTGLETLKTSGRNDITWAELSPALNKLANINTMEVNGIPVPNVKEKIQDLINSVMSGEGINVVIATGGGVYADIADHCGDFNASIALEQVSYGGLTVGPVTARMATDTTVPVVYLNALGIAVEAAGAPSGVGGQVMPISDFYGYIIDLAFRTNAAESNLLLQTEAADRIYNNNGADAETMGHGSTMTFVSTSTDFSAAQMKELMGAIRVVFFDPMQGNKVLGYAKLDVANATVTGGNTVTASLYLYKTVAATTTYEAASTELVAAVADGTDATPLYVAGATEGTYEAVGTDATIDTTGATAYFVQKITAAGEQLLTGTDAKITALTQNTATAVSALVYLDGENVGNDDVAASAATSMTGTMNLQFASSANLVPMDYTPLMVGGTATPEETPEG